MKPIGFIAVVAVLLGSTIFSNAFAETMENYTTDEPDAVSEKIEYEATQDHNPFALTAYEQNYLLPFNYTFTSASPVYNNNFVPDGQKIQRTDVKFQLSLKTPIWRDFFGYKNALYLAYTQQSFWQLYNRSSFFRANNYQPEVFLENNVEVNLPFCWKLHLINVGVIHQSNGRGGAFERSWNRVYAEATFSKGCWLIALRPWLVLPDNNIRQYNRDIEKYLGHGRILVAYKFDDQVISLLTYNNFESGFKRGSVQLSYSFPLIKKIRGYVQVFTGYGQTLLEYNHNTTSVGLGLSFSDWL